MLRFFLDLHLYRQEEKISTSEMLLRNGRENIRDTILKTWEALSDRDVSFAIFWGQYQKYRKEMEDIGHAPTDEKEYEVLRKALLMKT